MPVEEELAASRVPEAQPLGLVAEQRAGKPIESSTLRLEPLPADVDDEPLAAAGRAAVILFQHVRLGRRHAELVIQRRRRECDVREHRGERRDAERRGRSGLVVDARTGERRGRRRRAVVHSTTALLGRVLTVPHSDAITTLQKYLSTSTKYHAKSTISTSTSTSKQKYLGIYYIYLFINLFLLFITPCLPLLPSRKTSPPFGWYSFYRPTEGKRLSRPGWFVHENNVLVNKYCYFLSKVPMRCSHAVFCSNRLVCDKVIQVSTKYHAKSTLSTSTSTSNQNYLGIC